MAATGQARAMRLSARLSLRDLARDVGVNATTILRWEAGTSRPSGAAALRYLGALDRLQRGEP